MRMVHHPVMQQGSNLCVCGSPVEHVVHGLPDDRLYLDLKGALERLCRAQTNMPAWWRADAQQAINIVQEVGSSVCPEHPEANVMSVLGAGFYGPTEGEKRRRNATPWLPPARTDPRLETHSWRIALDSFQSEYVVYHGPGDIAFTYDDLRDALVDLCR